MSTITRTIGTTEVHRHAHTITVDTPAGVALVSLADALALADALDRAETDRQAGKAGPVLAVPHEVAVSPAGDDDGRPLAVRFSPATGGRTWWGSGDATAIATALREAVHTP